MSDDELLLQSEDMLLKTRKIPSDSIELTPLYLESIASSLLVIARNSVERVETSSIPFINGRLKSKDEIL